MRVLLTGGSGLLGTWLRATTPDHVTLTSVAHRTEIDDPSTVRADLRDPASVDHAIRRAQPDLVIHAAYAKDRASIVDATDHLAQAATQHGATIVHVSTDAVFSGDGRARAEDSDPDPSQDYGRWKAEAERIVAARSAGSAAIVRISLVASIDPPDHVLRGIVDATADGPVWFDDEFRQPAMGRDVAIGIWRVAMVDPLRRGGVWHLPGPDRLSRHEIARRLCTAAGIDAARAIRGSTPPDSRRPRDLVLSSGRAMREIDWGPPAIG